MSLFHDNRVFGIDGIFSGLICEGKRIKVWTGSREAFAEFRLHNKPLAGFLIHFEDGSSVRLPKNCRVLISETEGYRLVPIGSVSPGDRLCYPLPPMRLSGSFFPAFSYHYWAGFIWMHGTRDRKNILSVRIPVTDQWFFLSEFDVPNLQPSRPHATVKRRIIETPTSAYLVSLCEILEEFLRTHKLPKYSVRIDRVGAVYLEFVFRGQLGKKLDELLGQDTFLQTEGRTGKYKDLPTRILASHVWHRMAFLRGVLDMSFTSRKVFDDKGIKFRHIAVNESGANGLLTLMTNTGIPFFASVPRARLGFVSLEAWIASVLLGTSTSMPTEEELLDERDQTPLPVADYLMTTPLKHIRWESKFVTWVARKLEQGAPVRPLAVYAALNWVLGGTQPTYPIFGHRFVSKVEKLDHPREVLEFEVDHPDQTICVDGCVVAMG